MECQLKKKKLNFYQMTAQMSVVKEETVDMIVPDMHPDILRIIESSGMTVFKGKEMREGKLDISGYVAAVVLYIPETGKGISRLELQIPFAHTFESPDMNPEGFALLEISPSTVEARIINPRKVYVRASFKVTVNIFNLTELEIASDVEGSGDMGIEMLRKENRLYVPIAVKDKTFTLVDELEIPGTKPPASEILRSEVILLPRDSRVVGSKVVFKGDAIIKTLYKSNEPADAAGIYPVEHELPFSQIIDMEGLEDKCDCKFNLLLSGMELFITGGDEESRVFSITLNICAQTVAYAEREADAIVDIYSTAYELSADMRPSVLTHLIDHVSKTQSAKDTIETMEPAGTILSVSVMTDSVALKPEKNALVAEALTSVLYIGNDGQLYSAEKRIPVVCPIEIQGDAQLDASVKFAGEAFAAATSNGIDARFALLFDCTALSNERVMAVTGVKVDTAAAKSTAGAPSVVLRKTQPDDTLWSIAKRHNTTMEDLITANGLESAEADFSGRMLLIPKKRQ